MHSGGQRQDTGKERMLTTITPYWNRPEMLKVWLPALRGANIPGVKHIIAFVGERAPDWVKKEYVYAPAFLFYEFPDHVPGGFSIGHYHNLGARAACSEWIMKLDIDALPNVWFFKELVPLLAAAAPNQWFNCGMFMTSHHTTNSLLTSDRMPLSEEVYSNVTTSRLLYCGPACAGPVATNFICRTKTYLSLGGCDGNFRGYGWEDYQQIYMLERHQLNGLSPLPGKITFENVTQRCCREISRRKARELFQQNKWLSLLHRHHLASSDTRYKSHERMLQNRRVLLDYILRCEQKGNRMEETHERHQQTGQACN